MNLLRHRGGRPAAEGRRADRVRSRGRLKVLPWRPIGLFVRAEMDHHLWSEALRDGRIGQVDVQKATLIRVAAPRAEVSAEILNNGSRCLRLGRCMRLVVGPLAGCVGIVVSGPNFYSLHIVRYPPAWEETEYVESIH